MEQVNKKGSQFSVMKSCDEKKQVFGWASVSVRVQGDVVVDQQDDMIAIEDLESAVYQYTANFGKAGEMHQKSNVGDLIESVVFTSEKAKAMGISLESLPQGWWVGFHIHDEQVWAKIKDGTYSMFSIEGTASRMEECRSEDSFEGGSETKPVIDENLEEDVEENAKETVNETVNETVDENVEKTDKK